jgi:anti-sigma factor RsiW
MEEEKMCSSLTMDCIINDYVESRLSPARQAAFANYLESDEELKIFVQKSIKGKRALRQTNRMIAAPDFQEKLVRKIIHEKTEQW